MRARSECDSDAKSSENRTGDEVGRRRGAWIWAAAGRQSCEGQPTRMEISQQRNNRQIRLFPHSFRHWHSTLHTHPLTVPRALYTP